MTVKIYVGIDKNGELQEPVKSHERTGLRLICENLWHCFHSSNSDLYALVANPMLEGVDIDAVLLTNRGIGFLELKHYYGRISCLSPDGTWYANNLPIKPNKLESPNNYANPHKQVQAYMDETRTRLMHRDQQLWLPGDQYGWEELIFHTAVCFTHHGADIQEAQQELHRVYLPGRTLLTWESFQILRPRDICDWALSIGFDADEGLAYGNRPYRWSNEEIERVATQFYKAAIWQSMIQVMPQGSAFAYLLLTRATDPYPDILEISKDEVIVGRDEDCDIKIPESYRPWVSRKHARITRTVEGFFIEDLGSSQGTFVNNKRIEKPTLLDPAQLISLGGVGENACELRFSFSHPPSGGTGEPLSRILR